MACQKAWDAPSRRARSEGPPLCPCRARRVAPSRVRRANASPHAPDVCWRPNHRAIRAVWAPCWCCVRKGGQMRKLLRPPRRLFTGASCFRRVFFYDVQVSAPEASRHSVPRSGGVGLRRVSAREMQLPAVVQLRLPHFPAQRCASILFSGARDARPPPQERQFRAAGGTKAPAACVGVRNGAAQPHTRQILKLALALLRRSVRCGRRRGRPGPAAARRQRHQAVRQVFRGELLHVTVVVVDEHQAVRSPRGTEHGARVAPASGQQPPHSAPRERLPPERRKLRLALCRGHGAAPQGRSASQPQERAGLCPKGPWRRRNSGPTLVPCPPARVISWTAGAAWRASARSDACFFVGRRFVRGLSLSGALQKATRVAPPATRGSWRLVRMPRTPPSRSRARASPLPPPRARAKLQAAAGRHWGRATPRRATTRTQRRAAPAPPAAAHAARRAAMLETCEVSYITAAELAELLQGCVALRAAWHASTRLCPQRPQQQLLTHRVPRCHAGPKPPPQS